MSLYNREGLVAVPEEYSGLEELIQRSGTELSGLQVSAAIDGLGQHRRGEINLIPSVIRDYITRLLRIGIDPRSIQ